MFVEKRERAKKFIKVDSLVLRVGSGEVRAGYEAGAEGEEEEKNCQQERFERRVRGDCGVSEWRRNIWRD